MKYLKKAIPLCLLALALVITMAMVSPKAQAATGSGTCGTDLKWSLNSTGTLTISGTGDMTNFYPNSSSPTGADQPWKNLVSSIKKVVIEQGVTSIGTYAFQACTKLTSVTIASSVTSIGSDAFDGCTALTGITIPSGITAIGQYAFSGCTGLTSINIPAKVTSIGSSAFYGCSGLTRVDITDISAWCRIEFYSNTSNPLYYAKNLYLNSSLVKNVRFPDGLTKVGNFVFYNCTSLTSVIIPDSVTAIGSNAFRGCTALNSVLMPDDIKTVGQYAFSGCSSLKSLNLSSGVTDIGERAFNGCSALTGITIPEGVTGIASYTFSGCIALEYAVLPEGITSISDHAFNGCTALKDFALPESLTALGSYAFENCTSLTELTVPAGVSEIKAYTFNGCSNLARVTLSEGLTAIRSSAFKNCAALQEITVPDSVTTLESSAFYQCTGLKSATFGKGITQLPTSLLYGCTSLESVSIGNDVTVVNSSAFYSCPNLKYNIYDNGKYLGNEENPYVVLMAATAKDIVACRIHKDTKVIQASAFSGCKTLESVIVPDALVNLGSTAFYNCTSLKYNIYDNAKYLGSEENPYLILMAATSTDITGCTIHPDTRAIYEKAFAGCTALTSITVPDSVTSIGSNAFQGCSGLVELTVPFLGGGRKGNSESYAYPLGYFFGNSSYTGSTYTTQYYANINTTFSGYYIPNSLRSVTVTDSELFYGAFYNCSNLTSVTLGSGVTAIGGSAFYSCSGLQSVNIPEGMTSIGSSAFCGCSGLKTIIVPDSVTAIGSNAFAGCASLESLTVPFVGGSPDATEYSSQHLFGYIFGSSSSTGCASTQQYYNNQSNGYSTYSTFYIPTGLKTVTVTGGKLLNGAFYNCSDLTSVTLGDGVTFVDQKAFYNCTGLTSIIIGSGVADIGSRAFYGCTGLTSIALGDNVINLGEGAFYGCSKLESVTIGNGVTKINSSTFYNCSGLTSLAIGSGISEISKDAFYGCSKLQRVDITDLGAWCGIAFETANANPLYYAKKLYLNGELLTNAQIPEGIVEIGKYAFYYCSSLTSIVIPDSVTTIGQQAFYYCSGLTSITIPGSVTTIGQEAFSYCTGLTSLTIPDTVTTIEASALRGCSGLTSLTLPFVGDSRKTAGDTYQYPLGYLFGTNSFTNSTATKQTYHGSSTNGYTTGTYYIPNNLKTVTVTGNEILSGAFQNCVKLTNVYLSSNVTTVYSAAFTGCTGLKYNVYEGANYLGNSENPYLVLVAATATDITACQIHVDTRLICNSAFAECQVLDGIIIPSGVIAIGEKAFYNCTGLTGIAIPDSVTTLGSFVFYGCAGLKSITLGDGLASLPYCTFYGCTALESVTLPESVDDIGIEAFDNCTSLQNITLPEGINTIGRNAFYGCTGLVSIVVPDSVTELGSSAFYGCNKLARITLGSSLAKIGYSAFQNCTALEKITLPDSVTSVGSGMFYNCTNLKQVYLGKGINKIASSQFDGCRKLVGIWVSEDHPTLMNDDRGVLFNKDQTILLRAPRGIAGVYTVPETVTEIDVQAFYDCDSLTTVLLGNQVAVIDDSAFEGCAKLATLTLPLGVTTIDYKAFYSCSKLTNVYYHGTYEQWQLVSVDSSNTVLNADTIHYGHQHNYTIIPPTRVEPTCTEAGYIEYMCMYGDTYREVLPALDHSAGETVTVVAPTCTTGGYTVYTCTACGAEQITDLTPALDHDFSGEVTVVVGCTTQGYTETKCIRCDATQKTNPTKLTGHDIVVVPLQPATCTEDGYSSVGTKCSRCDLHFVVPTVVPALGHAFVDHAGQEPTCEEAGWKPYQTCERCDYTSYEELPALGHRVRFETEQLIDPVIIANDGVFTVSDGVYTSANKDNNSTAAVTLTATYACSLKLTYGVSSESGYDKLTILHNGGQLDTISGEVADKVLNLELNVGDVVEIRYSKDNSQSKGNDQGWVKPEFEQILLKEHTDISPDVLNPGCTEPVICSYCGKIAKEGAHSYIDHPGKKPTCEEGGWEAYQTCENCEYSSYQELPATGHIWEYHGSREPGCVRVGWEAYQVCTICGASDYKEIPALGHIYIDSICTVCGSDVSGMSGDLTGDGATTNSDVVTLLWYSLFPQELTSDLQVDYDGDGKLTNADVIKLLWYVLFPEKYPL